MLCLCCLCWLFVILYNHVVGRDRIHFEKQCFAEALPSIVDSHGSSRMKFCPTDWQVDAQFARLILTNIFYFLPSAPSVSFCGHRGILTLLPHKAWPSFVKMYIFFTQKASRCDAAGELPSRYSSRVILVVWCTIKKLCPSFRTKMQFTT